FAGIGESAFGAHTMAHLSKVTIVLLCIFFVLTLGLAVIAGHRAKAAGLDHSLLAKTEAVAVKEEKAPVKKELGKVEKKAEKAAVKAETKVPEKKDGKKAAK
ncbi:MAG: hypothetical protein IKA79_02700, partial [Lentisphaeria bacterium]|nr:hypothetical protein [Lentisphaeria bacterium]